MPLDTRPLRWVVRRDQGWDLDDVPTIILVLSCGHSVQLPPSEASKVQERTRCGRCPYMKDHRREPKRKRRKKT